jgi:hypothetical protein
MPDTGAAGLMLRGVKRDDRSARTIAYIESLPDQQRGALLLVLWLNALLTLALQGVQLIVVVRALWQAKRSGHPLATIGDRAVSPSVATVLSVSAVHKLSREHLVRQLDQRAGTA